MFPSTSRNPAPFLRIGLVAGALSLLFTACNSPSGNEGGPRDVSHGDKLIRSIQEPGSPPPSAAKPASEGAVPDQASLEAFLQARNRRENSFVPPAESASPGRSALPALKKAAAADCNIDFNSSASLGWIGSEPQAYNTFALWPFYIGDCSSLNGWAYVVPKTYNHYHLGYESPHICYGTVPGKVGIMQNGTCVQSNYDAKLFPRNISPHTQSEFVRVYVNNMGTKAGMVFNLKSIYLPPASGATSGNIKLWILKANGEWRYWANLAAGTTWTFPQTGVGGAQGIKEIQITSAAGYYGWTADNIVIGPYYGG